MNAFLLLIIFFIFFEKYNSKEPITVHIVPHTHDDAGWLNTFQEYFDGKGDLNISVSNILDNMVYSLNERLDRTFIYVEIAYFEKWYNDITEEKKRQVKELIKEGRLEFINGGYVMHDEAASYYQHMIDQMRLGHLFLKKEFNIHPEIGWYIDPFGHSAANAHILSKMGFKNIVLSRIDYKEKEIRKKNQTMEFVWKPFSQIENVNTEIFTHIQYDGYCMPGDLGFLIEDKDLNKTDSEIAVISKKFYDTMKNISKTYNHSQVLLTYGCDFSYRNRTFNFKNIERIMNYFEKSGKFSDMNLIYSTPSIYFKVIKEIQSNWPVYSNQDFFPYAEFPFSYWTGYFTSRPYLKGIVRDAGNFLLATSNFMSELIAKDNQIKESQMNYSKKLDSILDLRRKLGICQHHDAVAGTAKEYVSQNYIEMLTNSIESSRDILNQILDKLIRYPIDEVKNCIPAVSNRKCQDLVIKLNENRTIVLLFANNRIGKFPVSFRTNERNLNIYDESMELIENDIICQENNQTQGCEVHIEVYFSSRYIFNVVILEKSVMPRNLLPLKLNEKTLYLIRENNFIVTHKDGILHIYLPEFNQVYNITLSHSTYIGKEEGQPSLIRPSDANPDGAYVFAPLSIYPDKDKLDLNRSLFWNGTTIKQLSLSFQNSTMLLRFFRSMNYTIEIESIFFPMNITNSSLIPQGLNKVLHLQSNVDNSVVVKNISLSNGHTFRGKLNTSIVSISQPEFWTDSNGMKMMRRYKDFRGGWEYYVTDPVSANFYPINYAISIREKCKFDYNENDYFGVREDDSMITIFTERSQSGGVMKQGEIMLLMNRFSKSDDWKGLNENLYEKISLNSHFRMKNWISFSSHFNKRQVYDYIHNRPTIFSFSLLNEYKNTSLLRDFLSEQFSIESYLNNIISSDPCIILNYHILSKNEVLVQAYNFNDPYFTSERACMIHFKPIFLINYTFEELCVSGTHRINQFRELRKLKKSNRKYLIKGDYSINPQDIKLFLLRFN